MSILSTNKKLISIGAEYSAGQGIDISGHIISVVESAVGANYSAGPNIDIYDVEGQPTISSKDWSSDIADASANAYEQAIAQIPAPQDLSYISAKVDTNTSGINYISSVCLTAHQDWTDTIKGASSYSYEQSTSYFDNWVNGQYTGDVTNITNKISALSGDFSDYYKKTETSSKDEINDALQYVSANAGKVYEGVSPIVVNNDENKVSADTWTFSAGSNVSFVDDNVNKITRIDVELPQPQDLSYISAQVDSANAGVDYLSGVVITALPSDLATTGDVNDLAQSVSETYQTKGDYAERAFVLSSIESATSGKLDVSSFSSVSSDFLTNDDLNGYATEQWVENKGYLTAVDLSDYAKNSALSSTSSFLSGAIDYVSANAGDDFPQSADEAIQYVQTNSGTIDDTVTSYQTNSGTFLTAHQAISAEEWNDCYDNVNTNSGAWGGSALPISAGPGVKVNLVNNTLVFSNDETVLQDNIEVSAITFTLSEPAGNFDRLRLYDSYGTIAEVSGNNNRITWTFDRTNEHGVRMNRCYTITSNNGINWNEVNVYGWNQTDYTGTLIINGGTDWYLETNKIVGINRIAGGN